MYITHDLVLYESTCAIWENLALYIHQNLVKGGWQSCIFQDTPKSVKDGHN